VEKVTVEFDEEKLFQFGTDLPIEEKARLVNFLRKNVDVFAWSAYEAPSVDPDFVYHHLNIDPSTILKRQRPQKSSDPHTEALKEDLTSSKRIEPLRRFFT